MLRTVALSGFLMYEPPILGTNPLLQRPIELKTDHFSIRSSDTGSHVFPQNALPHRHNFQSSDVVPAPLWISIRSTMADCSADMVHRSSDVITYPHADSAGCRDSLFPVASSHCRILDLDQSPYQNQIQPWTPGSQLISRFVAFKWREDEETKKSR